MTKKLWLLLALAVVLGSLSLYFNTDWFRKENIQIYHRIRPAQSGFFSRKRPVQSPATPVFFGFDRKLKCTDVRVISCQDAATNKFPYAYWHMLSDSNSVPTKGFLYGENIPGMRPAIKGAKPETLAPGLRYRLLIEAGSLKVQHEFDAPAEAK